MTLTACDKYTTVDGLNYLFSYREAAPACAACMFPIEEHDFSAECSGCYKEIAANDLKVVMADVFGNHISPERNDIFCSRSCLAKFLNIWGF